MFDERNKIMHELNRRLNEVDFFNEISLSSQKMTKDLFCRIADYFNFVQENKLLGAFCKSLDNKREKLEIDQTLKKEGGKLVGAIEKDFGFIKSLIEKNNIKILPLEKAFPLGVGTVSNEGALSLEYNMIEGFLSKGGKSVSDIPKIIRSLLSMLGTLEALGVRDEELDQINKRCVPQLEKYEEKLRQQATLIDFIRFSDYEKLKEVWDFFYNKEEIARSLAFSLKFGDILGEHITYPSLQANRVKSLNELKQDYLFNVHRFHNYLLDCLEEVPLRTQVLKFLWNSYGRTVVGLILIGITLCVLKRLGLGSYIASIKDWVTVEVGLW